MKSNTLKQPSPSRGLRHIQAKVPADLLAAVDAAVKLEDTDRSKFVRKALRAALPKQVA